MSHMWARSRMPACSSLLVSRSSRAVTDSLMNPVRARFLALCLNFNSGAGWSCRTLRRGQRQAPVWLTYDYRMSSKASHCITSRPHSTS